MQRLVRSFYFQVVFGVALPVLLALVFLSVFHSWRERNLVLAQANDMAVVAGEQLLRSLKFAMLLNRPDMVATILDDVADDGFAERIQIMQVDGRVKYDTQRTAVGKLFQESEPGCNECHASGEAILPFTTTLSTNQNILRVVVPIPNQPECQQCHSTSSKYLGLVVMDTSLAGLRGVMLDDLWVDALYLVVITFILVLIVYQLLRVLVVERVHVWREGLLRFAEGDFSPRIPVTPDEFGTLSATINYMAEQMQRIESVRKERQEVRERAIVEERERIARELHDGLAQLLGYVKTKALAARYNLQNEKPRDAEKNLLQLEEAAQSLSTDVREAILGLRTTTQAGAGLGNLLNEYAGQFSRMSGIAVQVGFPESLAQWAIPAETELQLLRIVQEACTNVRKHAEADHISICLEEKSNHYWLVIQDNGRGMAESEVDLTPEIAHFGLRTMEERAHSIGATLKIHSTPGQGTRLVVKFPKPVSS